MSRPRGQQGRRGQSRRSAEHPPGVRSIKACWTRKDARNALRATLTCAVEEQTIARNPTAVIRLSSRRGPKRKRRSWTVDEARKFRPGLSMIVHGHLWTHLDVSVPSMLAHLGIAV